MCSLRRSTRVSAVNCLLNECCNAKRTDLVVQTTPCYSESQVVFISIVDARYPPLSQLLANTAYRDMRIPVFDNPV